MKLKLCLPALFLIGLMSAQINAQEIPLVYDVENTGKDFSKFVSQF